MTEAARFARSLAESLREELEVETPVGPILMPSAGVYRSAFGWDSGWHYFWLDRLDPSRARAEIGTLLALAEPDGRVSHEAPLSGGESYSSLRQLQLALLSASFAPSGKSWFIDPPVHLVAAAAASADAAKRGEECEAADLGAAARRALAWIEGHRRAAFLAPPFDALPVILHPLESGTDFSPAFDAVYGRPPMLQARSVAILRELASSGYDLAGRLDFPLPLVFEPCFLAFYLGARRALDPGEEVEALVEAYWEACFDGDQLLFRQAAARPGKPAESLGAPTFSGLLPLLLYARSGRSGQAREAIARNALPGRRFWEGELPSFNPGLRAPRRALWRGGQSWLNMGFCHYSLLRLYGFEDEAVELTRRLSRRLEEDGPWEYLDARGGKGEGGGGGTRPFSWNGLLLPMAEGSFLDLSAPR